MKKILFILYACLLSSATISVAQTQSQKHLQAKDTLTDKAIMAPEKSNDRLHQLLHDWQLNFGKAKSDCQNGGNVVYSEAEYINRLYNMPSEMELAYNPIVRSYIDMYTSRRRELVGYMLTLGEYYFPMFEETLDRYGIPLELKYLPVIESALNPVAVSRAGATGLWQFMLRTGKNYGLQVNSLVDERRDPYKATEAAARFLKDLYNIYGDWNLVIAAYNCGPGNVNKAIVRSGGKRDYWDIYYHLPRETRGYVPAFIAANYVMNYAATHNICPVQSENMLALDTVHVSNEMHFAQISEVLDISVAELRRLNPQFKRDVIPGNYQSYALVLPTAKVYAFLNNNDKIKDFNRTHYFTHRREVSPDSHYSRGAGGNTYTKNVYYRVKKGDNLSKIARRNRTTVAQLKRWNHLRSSRIPVGKRLIVRKNVVKRTPPPAPKKTPAPKKETTYKRANTESTNKGDNVISNYLKESLKGNENTGKDEEGKEKEKNEVETYNK